MNAVCNITLQLNGELAVESEAPLWGTWTFHQLGLIVAAGFGGLACLISLVLIFLHATHYSKPYEQKHIIRILFMIPVYATISVVSYKFYRHAIYWEVLRDCYEAFAISSFFTLLCHYVDKTLHEQKNFFRTVKPRNWVWPMGWIQPCTGGQEKGIFRKPRSGLTWFNIVWIGVFQYCLVRVAMTFVAMITELFDRYCESSLNPVWAHVWVMSINALSVTIAMYCLIQFYIQLKSDLAEHKPFLKVCCIKLVIFFSFWQTLLISFLSSGNKPVISTGPRVSYIDVKVGIPCVLLTFEMAIFAIMHIFAFPVRPYNLNNSADPNLYYQGGFLGIKAIFDAFNPWDIIKASARGFRWLFVGIRQRHQDPSYKMENGISPGTSANIPPNKSGRLDDYDYDDMATHTHNTIASGPPNPISPLLPSAAPPTSSINRRLGPDGDDFNDRAALLSHPARMPTATDNPYSTVPSGTSTPYRHQSPPPMYAGTSVPQQYPPTYQHLGYPNNHIPPHDLGDPPSPLDHPHAMTAPHAITTEERVPSRDGQGVRELTSWQGSRPSPQQQWQQQRSPTGGPPPGWR